MVRIAGVDLPRDKRIVVSLAYIYGIGRSTSEKILAKIEVSEDIHIKDSTEDQVNAIRNEIGGVETEGNLCRGVQLNIKRLVGVGCYRGTCYRRRLSVRGQHTKTNTRTCKDPVYIVANGRRQDDRRK